MERRVIKNADLATASSANGGEPATFAQVQAEIEAAMAAGELSSLPQKFAWFEKKLSAALSDSSVSASELAALMQEAARACAAAADCSAAEAEKALDPTQYPDPVAARNTAESAAFMANRLKTMQPRLAAHFEKVYAAEQLAHYLAKLGQLAPERDALAAELQTTYEDATSKLLDVFQRVREFEQRARQQLGSPPPNCEVLERVDMRALDKVVLPDLNHPDRNVWPPPANFAATFVQGMGVPLHPGPMWSDPSYQERVAEERRQEQQRLAAHYEQAAKLQLDRENKELREQFEASQRRG